MKPSVDPEIAKAIEEDIAAEDNKKSAKTQEATTVESVPCECVVTGWKPGLIDDRTLCPKCQGSAKVAKLAEG